MSARPFSLLQCSASLIELGISIVIIGMAETGMCIDAEQAAMIAKQPWRQE
jgi:hypothetical protein